MHLLLLLLSVGVLGTSAQLEPDSFYQDIDSLLTDDSENLLLDDDRREQLSEYLLKLLAEDEEEIPKVYLPEKRSRYYRRYPGKRHNSRSYDPEQYLCTPTRQEVVHLLLALHDARSGNLDRQVQFCNRRRPARAIFTNIRFLGRR